MPATSVSPPHAARGTRKAHARVERVQARRMFRSNPAGRLGPLVGPPLLSLLAAPVAAPVLLWFAPLEGQAFAEGLAGLVLRLGLVLCGAAVLVVHGVVLRGPDRAVLDPHPVDPRAVVPVLTRRVLARTGGLAPAGVLLLVPLVPVHGIEPLLPAALVLGGAWAMSVLLGLVSALGGVWAAEDRRLAGVLEAIRGGGTPRMQAALIYAPALAVGAGGGALFLAGRGIPGALTGDLASLALLLAPLGLAAVAAGAVGLLSERTWYRATVVLAEVDAAWARLEPAEERHEVYLQWTARWVPAGLRPHYLRSLRQAWRVLRSWTVGAWGLGVVAAFAGWTADPAGPARALAVSGAALAFLAGLALRMEGTDPAWLQRSLDLPPLPRLLGRALATWACLQGAVLPAVVAVAIRQGSAAVPLAGALEALSLLLALGATSVSPLRLRGWLAYAPLAVAAWLLTVRIFP